MKKTDLSIIRFLTKNIWKWYYVRMEIYFFNIANILEKYGERELRKKHGSYHHYYSRILLDKILKKIYRINTEISEDNGRPFIPNSALDFSISHSKDIIGIAFNDQSKIGLDIEYIKPRNYTEILHYYGADCSDISQNEFYQIWTTYEAEFKSGVKNHIVSFKYKDYMVSLSSECEGDIKLFESNIDDIDEELVLNNGVIPNYLPRTSIKLK